MKNFLKKFLAVMIMINFALVVQMTVANADNHLETPSRPADIITPLEYLRLIEGDTNLPSFTDTGQHPESKNLLPGAGTVTSPILFAIDFFKYVISGVALIMAVVAAIKLVSTDAEEKAKEQKQQLTIGVVGLLVVQFADTFVREMVFGDLGDAFQDVASAQYYAEESVHQIRGIIGMIHLFLGAAAVLVIVIRAGNLIYEPGDEEAATNAKTSIVYALIGLAIVGLSEIIVRGFVFPDRGERLPDLNVSRQVIVSLTNYVSSFVALFAFLALFFAGYRYVVAGGNEEETEKVKKVFIGAVLALVLALGAFALVNTFITLDETIVTQV